MKLWIVFPVAQMYMYFTYFDIFIYLFHLDKKYVKSYGQNHAHIYCPTGFTAAHRQPLRNTTTVAFFIYQFNLNV